MCIDITDAACNFCFTIRDGRGERIWRVSGVQVRCVCDEVIVSFSKYYYKKMEIGYRGKEETFLTV